MTERHIKWSGYGAVAFVLFSILMFGLASTHDLLEKDAALLRAFSQLNSQILVFASAFFAGRLCFRLVFQRQVQTGLEGLVAAGFGFIFLSCLGFVLCALQLYRREVIFPALLIMSAIGLWKILPLVEHPFSLRSLKSRDGLPILVLAVALLFTLLQTLSPPQRWDELVYHLELPKLYLARHGFYLVPSSIYAWFPQNQEMIYGMIMAVSEPVSARLFQYLTGIMVLVFLGLWGRELFGSRTAGVWAAVFFGVSGTFSLEASSAYIELGLCFMVLLSVYCAWKYRGSRDLRWLLAAGIFSGGALGVKYMAVGPVLATALLIFLWSGKRRFLLAPFFLLVSAGFVLPWWAHNLKFLGNPFYPFATQFFPGGEWDHAMFLRYSSNAWYHGMGRTVWDYLLLFPRLLLWAREESFWFDASFNPLLFFIPVLWPFFFTVLRKNAWLWLWFLSAFVVWAAGPQHGRFFLPGIAVLSLMAGGVFREMVERAGRPLALALYVAALLISLGSVPRRAWQIQDEARYIAGRIGLDQYLVVNRDRLGLMRINELLDLNRLTPPDARIFMLNENRCFYLQREFLADSAFEVSYTKHLIAGLGTPENFRQWLDRNGFTYVYNGDAGSWDRHLFLLPEALEEFRAAQNIYEGFKKRYGQVIFRERGELIKIE
jgi:hypothetical protein